MTSAADDGALFSPTLPPPLTRRETVVMMEPAEVPLIPLDSTSLPLSSAPEAPKESGETESTSYSLLPLPALTLQTLADERQKDALDSALARIGEYEKRISEKEDTVTHLRRTVAELSKQLKSVAHFIDLREDMEERLSGMERRHDEELNKYKTQAKDAAFDCLESKIRLKLEESTMQKTFEQKVAEQAEALLHTRTKEIHQENFELIKDKLLLSREVEASRVKWEALEKENEALRTERTVLSSSEKEVLQRSVALKKQVDTLKKQVKTFDDASQRIAQEFSTRLATQAKQHEKALKAITEERDAARADALQCREEWKRLRAVSSSMLSLQQDLHLFFHDALRQVREEMVAEKRQRMAAMGSPTRYLEGTRAPPSITGHEGEEERKRAAIRGGGGGGGVGGIASVIPLDRRLAQKTGREEKSPGPPLLTISSHAASSSSGHTQMANGHSEAASHPPPVSHLLPPPLRVENAPTASSIGRMEFQQSLRAPLRITYDHRSAESKERSGERDAADHPSPHRRESSENGSPLHSSFSSTLSSAGRWSEAGERGRYSCIRRHPCMEDDSNRRESDTDEKTPGVDCFSLTGGGGVGVTSVWSRSRGEWGRDRKGFPVMLSKPEDPIRKALLPPLASRRSSSYRKAAETSPAAATADEEGGKSVEEEGESTEVPSPEDEKEGIFMDALAARWGASVDPRWRKDGAKSKDNEEEKKDRIPTQSTEARVASSDGQLVECDARYPASVTLPADLQERKLRNISVRQLSWEEKERVIYYLFKRLQQSPHALQNTRRVCRDHPSQKGRSAANAPSPSLAPNTVVEGPSFHPTPSVPRIENKPYRHPPPKNPPRAIEEAEERRSSLPHQSGLKRTVDAGVNPKTFLTQQ